LAAKITRQAEAKRQLSIVKPGFNADAHPRTLPRPEFHGKPRLHIPRWRAISGGIDYGIGSRYLRILSLHRLFNRNNVPVFGMGLDLAAALSVYSGLMAGDGVICSIGGKPKSGLVGGLTSDLGLLGEPQGLSASHNRFEADVSPTRADLYTRYGMTNSPLLPADKFQWRPSISESSSIRAADGDAPRPERYRPYCPASFPSCAHQRLDCYQRILFCRTVHAFYNQCRDLLLHLSLLCQPHRRVSRRLSRRGDT
jgi:hypothetical protein